MSDDETKHTPYEREGETVYATDAEEQGSVTFGSSEEYDKPYRDPNWLYHQYHVMKKSAREIASEIGVTDTTILDWIDRHDIETRSASDSQRLRFHGSTRPWEDREWLYEKFVDQGKYAYEIANEAGVSRSTIERYLKHHGIEIDTSGGRYSRDYPTLTDASWLENEYEEKGRTQSDIADEVGCSSDTVRAALIDHGISVRSRSENQQNRYTQKKSVSKSEIPDRSTKDETVGGLDEESSNQVGKRSYSGPASGVDLSWSDSNISHQTWVPYRNEDWLRWQYDELGYSASDIAGLCEVSKRTIYNWMDRFGIERDNGSSDDE